MIAVAATTTGAASGPRPIPGGDQVQGGLQGDEQPTFDHVLAREAQAEDTAMTPRLSADGTIAKVRDHRETGPRKEVDTAAGGPSDPALFFPLPLTPQSLPHAGGSAAADTASTTGTPEISGRRDAAITNMSEVTVGLGVLTGQALVTPLESGQASSADGSISVDRGDQPLDPKAGDPATVNLDRPLPKDAGTPGTLDDGVDTISNALKSLPTNEAGLPSRNVTSLTGEAARPSMWQPALSEIDRSTQPVTSQSDTILDHVGSLFLHTPLITTRDNAEAPSESSFRAHASPIISATSVAPPSATPPVASRLNRLPTFKATVGGDSSPIDGPSPASGAPSLAGGVSAIGARIGGPFQNQPVADQSTAPTIASAMPRSASDESTDKARATTSSAADKGPEPANPTANQPAWLLNPIVTTGESFAPTRNNRVATGQSTAPPAATSSAADRARHADAAPTSDGSTGTNVTGLPVVHAGQSNGGASSGQPTRTAGTGAEVSLYQPIAQRVLVHGASLHVAGASSSFNVVLNPRSLGMVTVHVARGQEGLQVTITPQQTDTTALLNKHLPDLVGMLKQGGQDLPVQAQVVQTHGAEPTHHGTPQATGAGQSGLNTSANAGGHAFTGQQGNTEQGAWAATANDLFGVPDRGPGEVGPAPAAIQSRIGGAARVDIQA